MKVTMKWEEGADTAQHTTIKLTLPRKWKEGETLRIKEAFVEQHNVKHAADAAHKLVSDQVHLLNMKGHAIADKDIVCRVFESGEHIRVKPGAPPERLAAPLDDDQGPVAGSKGTRRPPVTSIPTPTPTPSAGGDGHVTSKAALDAAREATRAFDYSKWDRLDLSDDDDADCHPNIDKASWKRLMAQKRADRRATEDKKIQALKGKIEKYSTKVRDIQAKIDAGDDDAQLLVDVKDAQDSADKYQAQLDQFLASRKLTADDLCDVAEDRAMVAEKAEVAPLVNPLVEAGIAPDPNAPSSGMKPEKPADEGIEYDAYIRLYKDVANKYARLRSDEASEAFLLEHPELLNEHAEGYLLLLTLDTCMIHLEERQKGPLSPKVEKAYEEDELGVARQHLLIQFVLTLSKGKQCDPRDMIKPFFRKTAKNSVDRVEGFEEDLAAFVARIRNRAQEKMDKGESSPLASHREGAEQATGEEDFDESQYERAGLGPGGLDPNEVLPTLPKEMQEAFIDQDTDRLKRALQALGEEEAVHHMQRCIDSGLWMPGPTDVPVDDDEEEDEQDQEK
ncbi:Hsp90 co-chaperone Cdc37 (Hsp90 chaperone protein kinase-targeting subunit) (Protein enhancer of sevenless 3B) [Durusdinium trenchii]|uniref:Hsp90 chaperone protein kinase-targeting subunit n=1 Tax=Durusdinium trenchii TaxID=1381693 RepID=A0ABP0LGE2_9DINO